MPSPLDVAKRLLAGEEVKIEFETKTAKHDWDYQVFKKLLDLTDNDLQTASRTIVRLKSRPTE